MDRRLHCSRPASALSTLGAHSSDRLDELWLEARQAHRQLPNFCVRGCEIVWPVMTRRGGPKITTP